MIFIHLIWMMILFTLTITGVSLTIELIKERRESSLTILLCAAMTAVSALTLFYSIRNFIELLKERI